MIAAIMRRRTVLALALTAAAGGGFDQGLAFAVRLVAMGWRVIAPSRFGYLRTEYPPGATPDGEADAYVDLLDALDIARAPVIGGSSGAQPAIAFAIRHPDRCAALLRAAAPAEQARARAILHDILPVSERARGFAHDARFAGDPPPQALERIAVPTLAVSMTDDHFQTAAAAHHIASSVGGAEPIFYPTGGHIWVGRQAEQFASVNAFLRRVQPQPQ